MPDPISGVSFDFFNTSTNTCLVFRDYLTLHNDFSTTYQGRRQGGLNGSDEPPFQRQNLKIIKIIPNLIALNSPVATCLLALLCTTLVGHNAEPLQIIYIESRDQLFT